MQEETDITDKTELKWGGGYIDDPEHDCKCECIKCEYDRANYQTNFEEEHDH